MDVGGCRRGTGCGCIHGLGDPRPAARTRRCRQHPPHRRLTPAPLRHGAARHQPEQRDAYPYPRCPRRVRAARRALPRPAHAPRGCAPLHLLPRAGAGPLDRAGGTRPARGHRGARANRGAEQHRVHPPRADRGPRLLRGYTAGAEIAALDQGEKPARSVSSGVCSIAGGTVRIEPVASVTATGGKPPSPNTFDQVIDGCTQKRPLATRTPACANQPAVDAASSTSATFHWRCAARLSLRSATPPPTNGWRSTPLMLCVARAVSPLGALVRVALFAVA